MTDLDARVIRRLAVTGVVQGVGFRPFVRRLATALGLDGAVGNEPSRVVIDVAGPVGLLDEFVAGLRRDAPPLAVIDGVAVLAPRPSIEPGFVIAASGDDDGPRTVVPPDAATCGDCRRELFDPDDRRHGHPFITCTNCGPRFTIVTGLPYDRPATTMADFPLCHRCAAEYHDPDDRRYHAQPISCHDCGPRLTLRTVAQDQPDGDVDHRDADWAPEDHRRAVDGAAALLVAGATVAVKGLGGYHLVCDAGSDEAVARLRARKHRMDKPLAVMVADVDAAARLATLDRWERRTLSSSAAPIVLAPGRGNGLLSDLAAPGNPLVGLMVAYTPLHHLLLAAVGGPLVVTSANRGGEPLASDRAGIDRLADLYDAVLDHDRAIANPCDDSIVRLVEGRLLPVRRARGYTPMPIDLADTTTSVLAVGADLKNTFCLAGAGRARVSQHLGDMENLATIEALARSIDAYERLYEVRPDVVAVDAHPGYRSAAWARTSRAEPIIEVQHHHAHVAAVMAEHAIAPDRAVLGFAFDGTGYGHDGAIWGGEALMATASRARRVGHLLEIPLPGGDTAVRNPWRMALAHLREAGVPWTAQLPPVAVAGPGELDLLDRQIERRVGCVPTTSMGRLFDAVASLIGLRHTISYEAQAAIELEHLAGAALCGPEAETVAQVVYRFALAAPGPTQPTVFDQRPVVAAIVNDLAADVAPAVIAARFHLSVARLVGEATAAISRAEHVDTVALTGGVFQNVVLTSLCRAELRALPVTVIGHELVPPNDGGVALGQAFVAANTRSPNAHPALVAAGRRPADREDH